MRKPPPRATSPFRISYRPGKKTIFKEPDDGEDQLEKLREAGLESDDIARINPIIGSTVPQSIRKKTHTHTQIYIYILYVYF